VVVASADARLGSPTASLAPVSVAFWNARHGLLGAIDRSRCTRPPHVCPTIVSTTADGGRTWRISYRARVDVSRVTAVPGGQHAWAAADCTVDRTCPAVRASADGGRTWRIVPGTRLFGLTFGTGADGWALRTGAGGLARLLATTDGGRTWLPRRTPCERGLSFELDASRASRARGWILCLGQPGAGSQAKSLFASGDGGRTWSPRASTRLSGGDVRGFPGGGYGAGVEFRPSGRGWLWESRGSFLATIDGGGTWKILPISRPELVEAISVSFVSDRVGFALFHTPAGITLARTADGGVKWVTIRVWAGVR
jgi:hypothetical protein